MRTNGVRPEFINKSSSLVHNGIEYLHVTAAATRAGVTNNTIRTWIDNGHLSAVTLKGRKLVRADALDVAKAAIEAAQGQKTPFTDEERALINSDRSLRDVSLMTGRTMGTISSARTRYRAAQAEKLDGAA